MADGVEDTADVDREQPVHKCRWQNEKQPQCDESDDIRGEVLDGGNLPPSWGSVHESSGVCRRAASMTADLTCRTKVGRTLSVLRLRLFPGTAKASIDAPRRR